jgi:4-aminobutyrate--pyruvate transaminase
MNVLPNSAAARDIANQIHPQTNLRRHAETGPVIFTRGEGVRVFDEDGKDYIETVAGLWCASLGFSANERVARVAYEQMRTLGYYHSYRHRASNPSIDLAEALIRLAPVPMSKALFFSSGSEANDTAVKLAWYYHHAIGKPEKRKIIGRLGGYHGSTIGAISVAGKPDMHADFNLPLPGFVHTDKPHFYRYGENGESEESFATRMAENLERLILDEGPETVAAFFAEPVMGAGGGIVPPVGYFEKVQAVLAKYEVLFVADEVICGFGRTGNWWGSQTFDLKPDMISSAKALSAAFQPISALLVNDRIYQAMLSQSDKLGAFAHGSTYSGHPVAAAVAREVIAIYEEEDLIAHAAAVGAHMRQRLEALADHPLVGEVSGVGLLCGIDLVQDKDSHACYPAEVGVGARMDANGQRHGLVLRVIGDRIVFAPPLIIEAAEVGDMVERFARTLDDTWQEVREL